MQLQYVASVIQPPAEAFRAYGARLIAREFESGSSGIVWDRQDAQPEEPRLDSPECPEGKRLFAAWVNEKGYPFLRAYVNRCGLPDELVIAMVDGHYAVQATTNGRHSGYLYVSMWEGPTRHVVETPVPPPPPPIPGSLPHAYVADSTDWRKHKRCNTPGCWVSKSDRIHKPVKAAR